MSSGNDRGANAHGASTVWLPKQGLNNCNSCRSSIVEREKILQAKELEKKKPQAASEGQEKENYPVLEMSLLIGRLIESGHPWNDLCRSHTDWSRQVFLSLCIYKMIIEDKEAINGEVMGWGHGQVWRENKEGKKWYKIIFQLKRDKMWYTCTMKDLLSRREDEITNFQVNAWTRKTCTEWCNSGTERQILYVFSHSCIIASMDFYAEWTFITGSQERAFG